MKTIKIKVFGPNFSNSANDCYCEIMAKLKLNWIFRRNYAPTFDQVKQSQSIREQVNGQFDCNRREIIFSINP